VLWGRRMSSVMSSKWFLILRDAFFLANIFNLVSKKNIFNLVEISITALLQKR
jgi:hypothetical protein